MDSSCIITSERQTTWSNCSTSSATSTDYESGEDESDTDMTDDYMDVMFNDTSNYYINHNNNSTSNDLHCHHTIDNTCTNNYNTTISNYSSEDFNNSICANNTNNNSTTTIVRRPTTQTRMHVAMAVISRAILPTVVSLYYAIVRNQKTVVDSLRRRLLPAIVAFLANSISRSLSSVQAFRPIRKESQQAILDNSTTQEILYQPLSPPEKSVKCEIIVEPSSNETIRADVIFIHGLHGSLLKTWRQGTWNPDRSKIDENVKILRRASTGSRNIEGTTSSISILSRKRSVMLPVNCSVCCPNKKATMEIKEAEANETTDDTNKEHICAVRLSDISETNDKIETNNKQVSKCWPQDWLPEDCPGVRVIAINYTTDPYLWRPVWIKKRNRTSMEDRSKEMMEQLMEIGVGNRPIIWVAHSKGGLFVKQMIVNAWENRDSTQFVAQELSYQLKGFYQQTKGIMFYSVPHRGSSLADMNLPLLRQSIELTEIQKDCPFVLDLHRRFLQLCDTEEFNPEIFSFIETSLTLMSILYLRIVSVESADPGVGATCGVPLDHRDICKPVGRDCFLYQELAELINRVV